MAYRMHAPPTLLVIGYDPVRDLPKDHLVRMVEMVVEQADLPRGKHGVKGQPAFDPRLLLKVMTYSYATGVRSSRQIERLCSESLDYLFLTRGDTPCYRTLCSFRVKYKAHFEKIWLNLFGVASECGLQRLGRIAIDSSKFRADASPESVVKEADYQLVLDELKLILEEAEAADKQDEIDPPGQTLTGLDIETEHMREILRRVSKRNRQAGSAKSTQTPQDTPQHTKKRLGKRMRPRLEKAIKTLEEAIADGDKYACLTDPDARMMKEGREKKVLECHSYEVVVDSGSGLIAAGQSCQSPVDNPRLELLFEAASENEPDGITHIDADSGYYSGDAIGRLLSEGIDTCIPDSNTAGDLHRGQPIGTVRSKNSGKVPLIYDPEADCYTCPENNRLLPSQRSKDGGQEVKVYRAEKSCSECPLAKDCLTQANAKYRTVKRGEYADVLEEARQRFSEPEHQDRYHHRGEAIETIFGFIRSALGYKRWQVRGKDRVAAEAALFTTAYQLRKVHLQWAQAIG
jgi:transposase